MKPNHATKKKEIGNKIKEQRLLLNLTQKQVSNELNISKNFFGDVERGKKNMSPENLCKVAEFLNISVDFLMDKANSPYSHLNPKNLSGAIPLKSELVLLLQQMDDEQIAYMRQMMVLLIHFFQGDI